MHRDMPGALGNSDEEPCKDDVPGFSDVRLRPIRCARGLLVVAADLESSGLVEFLRVSVVSA